uniref:Uncharacterized protein LOC113791718 n=1 Tax=Dermatophagoides pteronyssinus TaxID=6956 RepID=A0A6P6XWB0_DERPT
MMMMMTTTDGNNVDESKMTLHRQQPAVDQMLNHVGDDENNSSNHHCHLMNELEKISKEKNELEQKLNELQSKQQQQSATTTESVNLETNHAVQSSAATEFSIREEPEGANNTDSDLNINNQDNYQQEEFDNQNRLIKELETKLSTLTAEHDDLCQRYHSSQNENQIFERRFKETEEESVKLQH